MATFPFSQYDPSGVFVTFRCPLFTVTALGFAEGTFVEAKRDEAAWTKKVGVKGDVVRVKNRNRSGTIKWTLLPTSPTNGLLSQLHSAGEDDVLSLRDVGEIQIKSFSDRVRCHAGQAWLQKVTDIPYGKDLPMREWVFDCAELGMDLGDDSGIDQ